MQLTRRELAGVATCAICAAAGLTTTASAQSTGGATQGLTRKVLSQMDGPAAGYVTVVAQVEIEPGVVVARHTHPGIESSYVVSGGLDLPIEGKGTLSLKPGDGFQVPAGTPHAGGPNGPQKTTLVSTYVVEKGKPLASPA
jgi:quercetin dioxygenase-like cupin family protein